MADCPLTNYTASTCSPYTTDNDGLWTSLLVAAESFRYQVTKNVSAKYSAWNLFKGMQFLVNVSVPHSMCVEVYLTLWVWKCTSLYGCGSVPHSMGVEVYLTLWVWKCTSLYGCGSVPHSMYVGGCICVCWCRVSLALRSTL